MNRSNFIRLLLLAPLGGQRMLACGTPVELTNTVQYLLKRQSADGAWRSDTYGAFKDGRALTPVVLRALAHVKDPQLDTPREKAAKWLLNRGDDLMADFPIHIAAAILETEKKIKVLSPLKGLASERLLELQVPGGGWSYSPIKPPPAGSSECKLPPMQQPNLSATALALDGMFASGYQGKEISENLDFIKSCQNFHTNDDEFDDGGFFQIPGDMSRNKAGRAGVDKHGRARFNSYAAATADGLRALLIAGEPEDSSRVKAAIQWLESFTWSPISKPEDLSYYTTRSMMLTKRHRWFRIKSGHPMALESAFDIRHELVEKRRSDGSWMNPAGEMRENCPLVATALALEACQLYGVKTNS